jgi:hypothetical protein
MVALFHGPSQCRNSQADFHRKGHADPKDGYPIAQVHVPGFTKNPSLMRWGLPEFIFQGAINRSHKIFGRLGMKKGNL